MAVLDRFSLIFHLPLFLVTFDAWISQFVFMQRNRTIDRMDLRMCIVVFLSILYFNLPPATIGESNYMVRTCGLQYHKLARYFHLNGDKCFMVFIDLRLLRFTVSLLPLTIRTFFFCFFINIIINCFLLVVIRIV